MINYSKFIVDAMRTNASLDSITFNEDKLEILSKLMMQVGNLLDIHKKSIFYDNTKDFIEKEKGLLLSLKTLIAQYEEATYDSSPVINTIFNKNDIETVHSLLGICTEAGEIAEHLKKRLEGNNFDLVGISEELSDIAWYDALFYNGSGIKFSKNESLQKLINKLRVRYPDKFNTHDANNRKLDEERRELE